MSSNYPPLRAYRRAGKLVLEIDEHRFCEDAFGLSRSRILDRDAFLAFVCENIFELVHDNDDIRSHPSWWLRLSEALGEQAADLGAGVRLDDGGEDSLPIDQPPNLFPDNLTRQLLGEHSKPTSVMSV